MQNDNRAAARGIKQTDSPWYRNPTTGVIAEAFALIKDACVVNRVIILGISPSKTLKILCHPFQFLRKQRLISSSASLRNAEAVVQEVP